MKVETEQISIAWIRRDGGTQVRALLDQATIERYAEAYRSKVDLPPPKVWHDGMAYWLGDGFHRVEAAEQSGMSSMECIVIPGTQRDARLYAVGANEEHGLPRSAADRRRAVELLLDDDEWGKMAVKWMAEKANVSWSFVDKIRKEWEADHGAVEKRTTAAGRQYPSRTKVTPARDIETPFDEPAMPTTIGSPQLQMPSEPIFDVYGSPVPPELIPSYMTAKELKSLATQIAKAKSTAENLFRADGGNGFHLQTVQKALDQAAETIRRGCFFVVCPECEGFPGETKCSLCGPRGWLSDAQFQSLNLSQKRKCERFRQNQRKGA